MKRTNSKSWITPFPFYSMTVIILISCSGYGEKSETPAAAVTASATQVEVGGLIDFNAAGSSYNDLSWTINDEPLDSCAGIELCTVQMSTAGSFEIIVEASIDKSSKHASVLVDVVAKPVVLNKTAVAVTTAVAPVNAYSANATWISAYDAPTQAAIHAGQLAESQVSTTASPLVFWVDANLSSSMFTDPSCATPASLGNAIACWKDRSPHHINATATSAPVWTASQLNSKPTMVFDYTASQYFIAHGVASVVTTESTIFMVARSTASVATNQMRGNVMLSMHDSTASYANILRLGVSPTASGVYPNTIFLATADVEYDSTLTGVTNNPYLFRMNLSNSANSTTYLTAASGSPQLLSWTQGTPGAITSLVSADTFSIGQEYDPGASVSDFFKGDIAEILVYNKTLTSGQISVVEAYLVAKWIP